MQGGTFIVLRLRYVPWIHDEAVEKLYRMNNGNVSAELYTIWEIQ